MLHVSTNGHHPTEDAPFEPGPWKVRWSPALLPSGLITVQLRPGCTLEGSEFHVALWQGAQSGGDGGQVSPVLNSSTRLEFLVESDPPPVGSYRPEPGRWRHHVRNIGNSGVIIHLLGSQAETGEIWPVSVWVPTLEQGSTLARPLVFVGKDAMDAFESVRQADTDLMHLRTKARPVQSQSAMDICRTIAVRQSLPAGSDPADQWPPATSFKIEGYRGFRTEQSLDLAVPTGEPGSGLTIIVGANNAGKSALWEGFDVLSRSAVQEVHFPESRRNSKAANGVCLALARQDGTALEITTPDPNSSRAVVSLPDGYTSGPSAFSEWAIVTVPARRQFRPYFGSYENDASNWAVHAGTYSRTELREGFAGRLMAVENNPVQKAWFDKTLSALLGYRVAWSIDAREDDSGHTHFVKIRPTDGISHNSEGAGEGVVSLMFIADALRDLRPGSVLVIDEPELSLHPEAIRRLRDLLSEKARRHQIVVLTHSPLLVDWHDIANGGRVARIHKVDGESRVSQPSKEILRTLSKQAGCWRTPHTLGSNANEVFFLRDQVIIVEGQEDIALFPTVLEQLGVELNGTFFGWGASGAGNIPNVAQLLDELGFEKVVGILDEGEEEDKIIAKSRKRFPDYKFVQIPAGDMRDKVVYKPNGTSADGTKLFVEDIKPGLLDGDRQVKSEKRAEAIKVLQEVAEYLGEP